jgi:hypothetical protein
MPIEKKSFLKPLLEVIILLSTINSIQLGLILDGLLYNFARSLKSNSTPVYGEAYKPTSLQT